MKTQLHQANLAQPQTALYIKKGNRYLPAPSAHIISEAESIYAGLFPKTKILSSPTAIVNYLKFAIGTHDQELFIVIFLNQRHGLIASEVLFYGTIDSAQVHPRVVVQKCLEKRASAVIFAHNHPSGANEPSNADRQITTKLKNALALIDVDLVDHFIISESYFSFFEHGLI